MQQWGFKDPRNTPEYENCDICANDIFRESWAESGVQRRAFDAPPEMANNTDTNINTKPDTDRESGPHLR